MDAQVIEMAPFKLKAGVGEAELRAASDALQERFLATCPGFLRRELAVREDGSCLDVVVWRSRADAEAAMGKAGTSEACAAYFSMMDMEASAGMPEIFRVLGRYG